jgi:hypothetical protein
MPPFFAKACPPKKVQTQINGRGIEGVESTCNLKVISNTFFLSDSYHFIGEFLENLELSVCIYLGKITAGYHRFAKSEIKYYMLPLLIDLAAFSIQKAGGVSIVWQELIDRMLVDDDVRAKFLQYKGAFENIQRQKMNIKPEDIIDKFGLPMKYWKFIDPINYCYKEPYIYHSTVYRVDHNRQALNVTTVHDFIYERYYSGLQKAFHSYKKK